jgi:glucose-fructose oxidoreductase
MQDRQNPDGIVVPADTIEAPYQNPIQYFADCLEHGRDITGPLSVEISRIGQQIVDTAYESARQKQTLRLLE